MAEAGLALINLESGDAAFVFQFFPASLSTTDRANWNAQETTVGVKPLFYANREPRRIEFLELYLDSTDTNESLTDDLKRLKDLFEETEKGMPPALLAVWGDRRERCVLEEISIEEKFFNASGEPTRAQIKMSLIQLQPETNEATMVKVGE